MTVIKAQAILVLTDRWGFPASTSPPLSIWTSMITKRISIMMAPAYTITCATAINWALSRR